MSAGITARDSIDLWDGSANTFHGHDYLEHVHPELCPTPEWQILPQGFSLYCIFASSTLQAAAARG